uniref:Uncharacterized protein n=1 Tax=Oryza meridionalis TaxID=40149 RepID=A0A0E0D1E0_9ORYZ
MADGCRAAQWPDPVIAVASLSRCYAAGEGQEGETKGEEVGDRAPGRPNAGRIWAPHGQIGEDTVAARALVGTMLAEEAGQGARWPDIVDVVPERNDPYHNIVLVLLGGEHGRLKPSSPVAG